MLASISHSPGRHRYVSVRKPSSSILLDGFHGGALYGDESTVTETLLVDLGIVFVPANVEEISSNNMKLPTMMKEVAPFWRGRILNIAVYA
eukprot:2882952-Ditylum_brightwellii.AAC.1